tara:strand:+ start:57 stop:221 length:165 start_codon:yes stop_codon:yes gene_type:complete
MPRMTKAQAKKRLNEAKGKVMAVYMGFYSLPRYVTTQDMAAIEKVIDKCLKRLD